VNPKYQKLAVLLLVAGLFGILIWFVPKGATPSVRFVEFRTSEHGDRVAVFRLSNPSDRPFSYFGEMMPFFRCRVLTKTGWQEEKLGWCSMVAGFHELSPHASLDFKVVPLDEATRISVGVGIERGTPEEIRNASQGPFGELRNFIRRCLPEPELTWSAPAP